MWGKGFKNLPQNEKVTLSWLSRKARRQYIDGRDTGLKNADVSESECSDDEEYMKNLKKSSSNARKKQKATDTAASQRFRREQIGGRYVLNQLLMHGRAWEDQPLFGSENGSTVVVDPFCGAATTLMQAHRLGMQSIGIDVDPMAQTLFHGYAATLAKAGTYEKMLTLTHFDWVSASARIAHITSRVHLVNLVSHYALLHAQEGELLEEDVIAKAAAAAAEKGLGGDGDVAIEEVNVEQEDADEVVSYDDLEELSDAAGAGV